MTTTEHPQPPAPLADHFTAVVGALDSLLAATGDATDGLAGHELSADLHATALTNLRGIATACDLDWDDLMAERDRRAVVAE